MGIYILKLTACLFIFWGIYKLLLERESIHKFKRIYLLSTAILSVIIPLITITQYVDPTPLDGSILISESIPASGAGINQPIINVATVLWTIYLIGVLIFSIRFIYNLYQLRHKIASSLKLKRNPFTYVLMGKDVNPHTFFNYIFFNKFKYESNALPEAVILHEETHAREKHSMDILFIELMQIIFWFNPILILFKRSIKLNHEFLADAAVISKGVERSSYQNVLLSFSSHMHQQHFANSINYSSFKKRFTVMKTKTSKSKAWLIGVLLLPIAAILLYSFSSKTIIERDTLESEPLTDLSLQVKTESKEDTSEEAVKKYNALSLEYSKALKIFLNSDRSDNSHFQKMVAKAEKLYASMSASDIKKYNIKPFPPIPAQMQKKATPAQIAEYNKLAKYYNQFGKKKIRIKEADVKRMEYLYSLMTDAQKEKAEPFPNLPPPPPPPPAPKKIKTKDGKVVEVIEVEAPAKPLTVKEKARLKEKAAYYAKKHPEKVSKIKRKDGKVVEVVEVPDHEVREVPPPPPPKKPLDLVIENAKKGGVFYYDGEEISSDEAIKIVKTKDPIYIKSKAKENKEAVYIYSKPKIIEVKSKAKKKKLEGAKLKEAKLKEAKLKQAKLKEAKLKEAKLKQAKLKEAKLKEAKLKQAKLKEAKLKEAKLKEGKQIAASYNYLNTFSNNNYYGKVYSEKEIVEYKKHMAIISKHASTNVFSEKS